MNYEWKILDVKTPDGELITEARYHVALSSNDYVIETEGNWYFREPELVTPFNSVTEEMVVEWVKQESTVDDTNTIEQRLAEQFTNLQSANDTVAPWKPQIFTPKI